MLQLQFVNADDHHEEFTRGSEYGVPRVGEVIDRNGGKNYVVVSIRWRDYELIDAPGMRRIEPIIYVREMGD
jgi:hypothetical protein